MRDRSDGSSWRSSREVEPFSRLTISATHRVALHEEVDVIGHHLKGVDRHPQFVGLRDEEVLQATRHGIDQDGAAVLRAPHEGYFSEKVAPVFRA